MFTFKHSHKLLKKFLYTAKIMNQVVVVTWFEKGKMHKVNYTLLETENAILSGDWIMQKGL